MSGFPVVWVGVDGRWYGSVGLNITLAMRKALQQALAETQNRSHELARLAVRVSSVSLADQGTQPLSIPACEEITRVLASAVPILKREKKRLCIFECLLEPELKEGLAGVFGVVLREEESR